MPQTLEIEYRVSFLTARRKGTADYRQASKAFKSASTMFCLSNIFIVNSLLRCLTALRYIEQEDVDVHEIIHFRDNVLLISIENDDALQLKSVCQYRTPDAKLSE